MNNQEPIKSLECIDLSSCTILDKSFAGVQFHGASFRGARLHNGFHRMHLYQLRLHGLPADGLLLDHAKAFLTDFSLTIFEACSVRDMQMRECRMEAVSPYSMDLARIDMDDATQATRTDLDEGFGSMVGGMC